MRKNSITFIFILCLIISNIRLCGQVIEAGSGNSFFICNTGVPMCSGWGPSGELGIGLPDASLHFVPTAVNNLTGIVAVSAGGNHTLFLKNDGTVWSCGLNYAGQLGDGTTVDKSEVVQVLGLNNIVAINAGDRHSLFLKSDGTAWSCGENTFGELGLGDFNVRRFIPEQIAITDVIAIAAGHYHSIFLKSDGTAWGSGWGSSGQLGNVSLASRNVPRQASINNVVAIAVGELHSIFLKNDGTVWISGDNNYGQLGNNSSIDERTPIQVDGIDNITAIFSGCNSNSSIFLRNDGTVFACGLNNGSFGQEGLSISRVPISNPSIDHVVDLSTNGYHTLFMKDDGTVWGCGSNYEGQLATTAVNFTYVPVQPMGLCELLLSTTEKIADHEFYFYPNPSDGIFYFSKIIDSEYQLSVHSVLGKEVLSTALDSSSEILNLTGFDSGIYFYKMTSATGSTFEGKLCIQ